jgi:hypothetical protein
MKEGMRRALPAVLMVTMLFSVASCNKGSNTTSSPTGPSNSTSAWTGTITRPSGQGTMTVSWNPTTDSNGKMTGPMTLTYKGVAVTIPTMEVILAGNSSGYTIHVDFTAFTGQIPAYPTCSINAASLTSGAGDPFPSPYNSINVALDSFYNSCAGFIDAGSIHETTQLTISK